MVVNRRKLDVDVNGEGIGGVDGEVPDAILERVVVVGRRAGVSGNGNRAVRCEEIDNPEMSENLNQSSSFRSRLKTANKHTARCCISNRECKMRLFGGTFFNNPTTAGSMFNSLAN